VSSLVRACEAFCRHDGCVIKHVNLVIHRYCRLWVPSKSLKGAMQLCQHAALVKVLAGLKRSKGKLLMRYSGDKRPRTRFQCRSLTSLWRPPCTPSLSLTSFAPTLHSADLALRPLFIGEPVVPIPRPSTHCKGALRLAPLPKIRRRRRSRRAGILPGEDVGL
jgi:hypothetical protein